jgi:hypothetical protein
MNRFLRRGVLGATAAGVAGFPFLLSAAATGYDFAVGIVSGIAYAVRLHCASTLSWNAHLLSSP